MTQPLTSSSSSAAAAASIPHPLTELEQAIHNAIPTPADHNLLTITNPNLLALMDSYAYDDHEQVAADKTVLTAALQGRLVTRLNNEAYSFCPKAVCDIIGATEIGVETPLLLACKGALIRSVTSDTGRGAQRIAQLTAFHALVAKTLKAEDTANVLLTSESSFFISREIERLIKQLHLTNITYLYLHRDSPYANVNRFRSLNTLHSFHMSLEEINDLLNHFSIVDPTEASKLRQTLLTHIQGIYDGIKANHQPHIAARSNVVLAKLESEDSYTSVASRSDLLTEIHKWELENSDLYQVFTTIHEERMKMMQAPRYRSTGHTLSKSDMTPIFERIKEKMEGIMKSLLDSSKQPNPDYSNVMSAVTELSHDTQSIRAQLPELPFIDAFAVRERLYQILQNCIYGNTPDSAMQAIMAGSLDNASFAVAADENHLNHLATQNQVDPTQVDPTLSAEHAELQNKREALKRLMERSQELHTAIKQL